MVVLGTAKSCQASVQSRSGQVRRSHPLANGAVRDSALPCMGLDLGIEQRMLPRPITFNGRRRLRTSPRDACSVPGDRQLLAKVCLSRPQGSGGGLGAGSSPSRRGWHSHAGYSGSCAGVEVCRPFFLIRQARIYAAKRQPPPFDARQLGRTWP